MSVTENGLWIAAPQHIEAAASAELIAETAQLARRDCPTSGRTYLLDESDVEQWDHIARGWNPNLPDGFRFNRVRRLYVEPDRSVVMRAHRDHPDFQGEVDLLELEGLATVTVQGLGAITLQPGSMLRFVAWPFGKDYPSGRMYERQICPEDPRTEHGLNYMGPREAIMLVYDANPTNPKEKYT